ncbi:MAG TPA: aminotransferase class I/II-fold pyridoxal phosphate-dependent enzyme [Nannocystaceae bacterium]|nr:aminotransferase class I/II-fold pyridoxal phosphate-dependent enzyme [Nannocystaceae bacterium]
MDASTFRDAVFQVHRQGRERGHYFLVAEDARFGDRTITVGGRRLLSFGSCSYLGLEFDDRLLDGAVDAYRRYRSQTSYSRGYLSCPLYSQLEEELLPAIFGVPRVLLLPSTSAAHHVAMPALIDERDAVVIDHQAHRSVDDAVTLQCARSNATKIVIRHGELDQAVETVSRLARLHRQVWFVCDGIYSMYGDYLPESFLRTLLAQSPNVRLYVDDAHGMSWAGTHGCGHLAARLPIDERVVLVTSLAKAFATGGGVIVTRDPAVIELARLVGGPYSFSGPLRPGDLGASVASAQIHLSNELPALQAKLHARVEQANRLCRELAIPLIVENEAPIFFIALGRAEAVFTMAERLRDDGFHVNVSGFPAVPASRGGLRVAINANHAPDEIAALFTAIARHLPGVLSKSGVTRAEVDAQFEEALPAFLRTRRDDVVQRDALACVPEVGAAAYQTDFTVDVVTSIREVDAVAWDAMLGQHAYIDAASMRAVESVFDPRVQQRPEYQWAYRYMFVRDRQGEVAAAAPLTTSLMKDDAFMSADVSVALEAARARDPYLFTSRAITTGTMVSEGLHIYLRPGPNRDAALVRLLEAGVAEMKAQGCRTLVYRDFPDPRELAPVFTAQGFVPMRLLDDHVVELGEWRGADDFIAQLATAGKRRHVRMLEEQASLFRCEIWDASNAASDDDVAHLHRLYLEIARKNLRINIFPLPLEIVRAHLASGSWELVVLWSNEPGRALPVAFGASRRIGADHRWLYCGVDYTGFDKDEVSPYRQLLWQIVKRAGELGCQRVHLGMGSDREKEKFGSVRVPTYAFVRSEDDYRAAELQAFVERLAQARTPRVTARALP